MRVLIVDDDMATVDVIANTVNWQKLGISDVLTAYNIDRAKKMISEQSIDLIVSDIEMPQGSGIELLRWYRQEQFEGEFLLLTCHERFDYAADALKLQASEYLLKPFDVAVMEDSLKRIIERLQKKRQVAVDSAYGRWIRDNQRQLKETMIDTEENRFNETDASLGEKSLLSTGSNLLHLEQMTQQLNGQQKMAFLSDLKGVIRQLADKKSLNMQVLVQIKKEILQAVYLYLGSKGIQIPDMRHEVQLQELEHKAGESVTDMLRWVNYLLDSTFAYEAAVQRQFTLAERVDSYIRSHYVEDIGRNELAQIFAMTPDHLAKAYKKETGRHIRDTLMMCRIDKAKQLLARGERVSDVATAVGFDNFTYFSTLFKKYTGISPNQYKKTGSLYEQNGEV